jgi:hypothetical protein
MTINKYLTVSCKLPLKPKGIYALLTAKKITTLEMKTIANHRPAETINSPKKKAPHKDLPRMRSQKRSHGEEM